MKTEFKPYYAVIFTSTHPDNFRDENIDGYSEMSEKMEILAKQQNGFLGMDSARNAVGITVSYWDSLEAIKNWKQQSEHVQAQQKGRQDWYSWYNVKICKVEREYEFKTTSSSDF
ncbi:antibiotic biosynthesis monooxygenase family protein [Hwangdonia lutea]|uniref:Antibiotic biosynthesis monooxygenase n=1 Tax=Hwangdonia lutea TaxID=3075823 RepID=A0AA97ESL2_9FLAO|nr:antibiotic biosynthesis monooxygenase [Hwangdonia sp. SCSIO 19198]WOD45173.1 antibiotic biosynthesis monooxygenase [Hwangdonia sp. SCSIO 19198]